MTDESGPLVELERVSKIYPGGAPLRVSAFIIRRGERRTIGGLDAGAAEMFVNLLMGASLPDEGEVRIDGRSTRDIVTDAEWLASLDRFGIVTGRAVLLDSLPLLANLALPVTLAIDPVPEDVRRRVEALAADVGIPAARLADAASTLAADERVRVHLARALAIDPALLILEHPTAALEPAAAEALGLTLGRLGAARGIGWIALTNDDRFARATGSVRLELTPTGDVVERGGFWRKILSGQRAKGRRQNEGKGKN